MTGYERIRELKTKLRRKVTDLIALSRQNDPFYCGSADDRRKAEWFAAIWERWFNSKTGIHLRRIHYTITTGNNPKKPNDATYQLTHADWQLLNLASKKARILGLVPADAIIDQRNPDPVKPFSEFAQEGTEPRIERSAIDTYLPLPSISLGWSSWELVSQAPQVYGYDPDDREDRAFNLALCIEKSTMESILLDLCHRELGVTYIGSIGFQSISTVVQSLRRWQLEGKPVRVFYISDADMAGKAMPTSFARQLEFWRSQYAPDVEVKLEPIALTVEQIRKYRLPKDENGKVELDALEALHPGELRKIVIRAIEPYLDRTIRDRLRNTKQRAQRIVHEDWESAMGSHEESLAALRRKAERRVVNVYRKEVAKLQRRMTAELEALNVPVTLATLKAKAERTAESFAPQLPGRPQPNIGELDESKWLFDSGRDYLEQLKFYKQRRRRES